VKETAFSGVFGTVAALTARGAEVLVHDPLYDDDELRGLGFPPYHLGDAVDAAVVQADHAAYRSIGAGDLPGLKVLVDGRRVTGEEGWGSATRIVLGEPLPGASAVDRA
jgi:UDP-N-acetyl-D-mannosaminuronate dehydrogenase